jgi:hypothetical protein
MFPLSIDGEIELKSSAPESDILSGLRRALAAQKANNISTDGRRIAFEAGVFRLVSNWNVLVPVGSGTIEIVPGPPRRVRYAFSCRQMAAFTTAMAGVMSCLAAREGGAAGAVLIFAGAWAWLFGMNYIIAAFRLPGFVRDAVESSSTA